MRPEELPGFTFAWIQLISSRHLLARLLGPVNRQNWVGYKQLLVALFDSLNQFSDMHWHADAAARMLYGSITRLVVVLLHDFPDFLAYYYLDLMRVLPLECIHLRNIILSAVPAAASQTHAPHLPPGWTRPNHGRKANKDISIEGALAGYVRAYPERKTDPSFDAIARWATKDSFMDMSLMLLYVATLCGDHALENISETPLAELVLYVLDHADGEGMALALEIQQTKNTCSHTAQAFIM